MTNKFITKYLKIFNLLKVNNNKCIFKIELRLKFFLYLTMDYKIVIRNILEVIFDKHCELSKSKYIECYSKVYSIVNNLDKNDYKYFDNCIVEYFQMLINILSSNINSNIDLYFENYDYYSEKALLGDKIFMYYQNEKNEGNENENQKGVISSIYCSIWDENILSNFYPFILNEIKNIKELVFDKNIFEKIEKYSLHINNINKDLNKTFKYQIFEIITLQKEVGVDKILEIINYYDKILNIFSETEDEDNTKKTLKNNILILIKDNENLIFDQIRAKFLDIKSSLESKQIESYSIYSNLNKLTNYFDNDLNDKYNYILFNILKINKYNSIDSLIKNINISDFMLYNLSPNEYYKDIKNDKQYYEDFLEKIIENISENFDNNFVLELVKHINKNMDNIKLWKHINIIINKMKNKEVFVIYYKRALKTRLLNSNISNLNNESYLIDILTKNNDLIDVSRLSVMLKDYQTSIVYSSEFNKLFNNNAFVNLTTYDMWGITPNEYDTNNFCSKFGKELETMKNDFKSYYLINNENRNVKFVDDISTCFIDFNGVELECNYLQADLLYQFNDSEYIDINNNLDKVVASSLLKPKILTKKDGKLFINDKFKYSKPSLKLYKLFKKNETKNEKKKVDKTLVFKKQEYVDCFIMRTLKKNKESYINCEELYNNTSKNLKNKFDVDKELFKERLSHLEDNAYLEILDNQAKFAI